MNVANDVELCYVCCLPVGFVFDVDSALITELGPGLGRCFVLWVVKPTVELEVVHPLELLGADVTCENLVVRPVLELVGLQSEFR